MTPVQIDFDKFNELLGNVADDIERRFLLLAFQMDIGEDGWSASKYTLTELHKMMDYKSSSKSKAKLNHIIEKYKVMGVVKWYPPEGWGRRFWFSFIIRPYGDAPHQTGFVDEVDAAKADDLGTENPQHNEFRIGKFGDSRSPMGTQNPQMRAQSPQIQNPRHNEIGDSRSPKSAENPQNLGTPDPQIAYHDYDYENDKPSVTGKSIIQSSYQVHDGAGDSESPKTKTKILWRDVVAMLRGIGVHRPSHDIFRQIPHRQDILTIVANVRAGHILYRCKGAEIVPAEGVRNMGAYAVALAQECLNHDYAVQTNFLQSLAMLEPAQFDPRVGGPPAGKRMAAYALAAAAYGAGVDLARVYVDIYFAEDSVFADVTAGEALNAIVPGAKLKHSWAAMVASIPDFDKTNDFVKHAIVLAQDANVWTVQVAAGWHLNALSMPQYRDRVMKAFREVVSPTAELKFVADGA